MTTAELDDGERAALTELLRRTIAADPFPLSPRVRTLRGILEKLEPLKPAKDAPGLAEPVSRDDPGLKLVLHPLRWSPVHHPLKLLVVTAQLIVVARRDALALQLLHPGADSSKIVRSTHSFLPAL